jgi:hypothetical protein
MTYQSIDVPDPSPANNARPRGWLTAVLRPAGTVDGAFAAAIGRSLADLSATADMVVVDLDAAQLPDAEAFVDLLRLPGAAWQVPASASSSSTFRMRWGMPSTWPMCPRPWPPPFLHDPATRKRLDHHRSQPHLADARSLPSDQSPPTNRGSVVSDWAIERGAASQQ